MTNNSMTMPESFGFQWHITDRCAGRCLHCYQSGFDTTSELPIDVLKGIAGHILEPLDIPVSINLTGGEPLLYPGLFDLISHIVSFKNLEELNLITSACDISDSTIDRITGSGITSLKISIESHIPEINDSIRGKGHFETVTNNIRRLHKTGLPIIFMVTLGTYNYTHIAGLCALALELDVHGLILERYIPLGRGAAQKESVLSSLQWQHVLQSVIDVAQLECNSNDLLAYKAFWLDVREGINDLSVNGALCNLGSSSMALMPDGTVYPCRRLPRMIGKLPSDSIIDILKKLDFYSLEHLSAAMRDSKCRSCSVKECVGCRALVVATEGELLGDDQQCGGPIWIGDF